MIENEVGNDVKMTYLRTKSGHGVDPETITTDVTDTYTLDHRLASIGYSS